MPRRFSLFPWLFIIAGLVALALTGYIEVAKQKEAERAAEEVTAFGTKLAADSIRKYDEYNLARLYRFDSLRVAADTTGMCRTILRNWIPMENSLDMQIHDSGTLHPQDRDLFLTAATFFRDHCRQRLGTERMSNQDEIRDYLSAVRIAHLFDPVKK